MNKKLMNIVLFGFFLLWGISFIQAKAYKKFKNIMPDEKEVFEEREQRSGFDFSAMDKIWEITSILEQDEEPSEDMWNSLIRTPGYAALISHERYYGMDFLKRNFRLVFKPSMAEELKKAKNNRSVQHFLDLKEKEAEIKNFQQQIQNPSVQAEALELLNPWFPAGTLDDREQIPASFIIFARDARGGYGRLIFDIIYALEMGEEFVPLFAHEAFHYLRGKSMTYDEGDILLPHQYILMAVDMIQNEGMADQIDKTASLFEGGSRFESSYAQRYRENLMETPRILWTLDANLFRLTEDNPRYSEIGRTMISAVPMSGHPTGYFMTRAILERLGKEELVRTFNNPFAFFYLYNSAALKDDGLPRLSNGAILGLYEMEKIYVQVPETKLAAAALVSGFDFSGVEYFRNISAVLMQDEEPESELWDRFFRNPGYRALFAHETSYSREKISEFISLVFKPSREAELEAALTAGRSYSLNHFIQHKKEMETVSNAVKQYRDGKFFNQAVNCVKTLLPPKTNEDISTPLVSFIYFSDDLRFGYPVMVVDPMYLVGEPDSFSYYLKLYLIWVSADRVQPFNDDRLTQREHAFIDGFKRIQQFGFCDLLSFDDGSLEKMNVFSRYENALSEVPQFIRELDVLLTRAADDPEVWKEFSTAINKFFSRPGCPVGYIMAKTIEDVYGRRALAECLGNPFAFILLYHKSALRKGDLPVFCSESLNYISQLESECCRIDQTGIN